MIVSALLFGILATCTIEARNDRPIIGILMQEYRLPNLCYIASSYVKFVEAGGARVVAIYINRDEAYYQEVLPQLNGVLFPGGGVPVNASGYARAGKLIYEYAVRANKRNEYFPLWGTCNGFEMLSYLSSNKWPMSRCYAQNNPSPLNFTPEAATSRLFSKLPSSLKTSLSTENITSNFHSKCVTVKNFIRTGVSATYRALSTSVDFRGTEYVSSMEAKDFPFYGTQFHPEKNAYEWAKKDIPHSESAIESTQYFARFFVNEARKSLHSMSREYFESAAIYNYEPVYTARNSSFTQMYFFYE